MNPRFPCFRYKVSHHVSVAGYLMLQVRVAWHRMLAIGLRPLAASRRFCFVTGCGNSGTTLLASKLGLHPKTWLIPHESHVFCPFRSLRRARDAASAWLASAGREGRDIVIEKTPKHVHSLPRIRQILPDSRCVLIVRNPLDTCASLYKRFGSLDYAIERWLLDNQALADSLDNANTLLVRYEQLTREPEETLRHVCGFLGLPWSPDILTLEGSGYESGENTHANMLIRKQQVSRPISDNNGKWRMVLDDPQAERVRSATADLATRLGYGVA